jgi:chromate transporter
MPNASGADAAANRAETRPGIASPAPTLAEASREWARIGVLSFGGPAGQIAMMHRVLVEQKRWLDERTYLLALNFCTLLPGPEAMQLATYAGWRLHGVAGGLVAGLLFVLPGAILMLALAIGYAFYGAVPAVSAVFLGVKAAVLAIVIDALLKISKRALHGVSSWVIAGLAFLAIFAFQVPFPLIVLAAGLAGFVLGRMSDTPMHGEANRPAGPAVTVTATLRTAGLWTAIWIAPLLALSALAGFESVIAKLSVFFSTLAIVTFGGAYAVLAYMAQEAVQTHGWLQAGEMLDGLGLAETTPGPLILVTEFVGYLAGHRAGAGGSTMAAVGHGILAAVVTLWATFAPSFLFIFTGAPYIERLQSARRLKAALAAITAAVVGIILNLSVWFSLHVLFGEVGTIEAGWLRVATPDVSTADSLAMTLAVFAAVMLFRFRLGIPLTLAACGALSFVASQIAG